jgi:sigma-E factor negative regulatory protein RseA
MNERISAFVDGELSEEDCGPALGYLRHDEKLRRDWDTYHLIGDVLRGDCHRSYSSAVLVELAFEPAMIAAPRPKEKFGKNASAFLLRAAAGVAAVGLVVWLALPMLSSGPLSSSPEIARSAPPPVVADAAAPAQMPEAMEEYLQAHQRFSPSGVIQGLARDVRPVSAQAGEASR